VAQDLAAYGRDADESWNIVDLLGFVSEVDGLERLRLLYLYPKEIRPGLIEVMARSPVVAPYFDLSLQHASGSLLRAMRRPGDGDRHLELIARIRTADPASTLRSSFIVGFPGESEDDVAELAGFLATARLDWAGFFPYSPEEGTPAAELDGRLPAEEVADRLRHLAGIQEEITAAANAATIGGIERVLVDQVEEGKPVGRSRREAPEIDGMITLDRGEPGSWVAAEVVAAFGADRQAVVLG
jgi:tRNA A37 methylthiotransferase MiaB